MWILVDTAKVVVTTEDTDHRDDVFGIFSGNSRFYKVQPADQDGYSISAHNILN